jgi:hypothetical protein
MLHWTDPQSALRLVQFMSGVGSGLASLEFIALNRKISAAGFYTACGVSRWQIAVLQVVRLILAVWFAVLPLTGVASSLRLAALVALTLYLTRLMPMGLEAADQMIGILLAAQLLASFAPNSRSVQIACLAFIALQAALAYGVAGWAKLLKPSWRNGAYLHGLIQTELYGHPLTKRLLANRKTACYLSLVLIAVECSFPLGLLTGHMGAIALCSLVLCMHLANAYVLGLNLFVWAFAATYPAVIFCAGEVAKAWTR